MTGYLATIAGICLCLYLAAVVLLRVALWRDLRDWRRRGYPARLEEVPMWMPPRSTSEAPIARSATVEEVQRRLAGDKWQEIQDEGFRLEDLLSFGTEWILEYIRVKYTSGIDKLPGLQGIDLKQCRSGTLERILFDQIGQIQALDTDEAKRLWSIITNLFFTHCSSLLLFSLRDFSLAEPFDAETRDALKAFSLQVWPTTERFAEMTTELDFFHPNCFSEEDCACIFEKMFQYALRNCCYKAIAETEEHRKHEAVDALKIGLEFASMFLRSSPCALSFSFLWQHIADITHTAEYLLNKLHLDQEHIVELEVAFAKILEPNNIGRVFFGEYFLWSPYEIEDGNQSGSVLRRLWNRALNIAVPAFCRVWPPRLLNQLRYRYIVRQCIEALFQTQAERRASFARIVDTINTLPWYLARARCQLWRLRWASSDLLKHNEAYMQTMIAALALERHRQSHASIPDDLEELENPIDPFSGLPLKYRRTDSGYIVYSVGYNGTDDGGDRSPMDELPCWPRDVVVQVGV